MWYYGMPGIQDGNPECQKPGCTEDWEEKYKDEHGNRVKVCEKHYYRLVVRQRNITVTGTMNPLTTPSSSSDRSLYEMSKERDLNPNMGPPEPDELKTEE